LELGELLFEIGDVFVGDDVVGRGVVGGEAGGDVAAFEASVEAGEVLAEGVLRGPAGAIGFVILVASCARRGVTRRSVVVGDVGAELFLDVVGALETCEGGDEIALVAL
jgi:hypothetical protein